jgi:hypothetical protein
MNAPSVIAIGPTLAAVLFVIVTFPFNWTGSSRTEGHCSAKSVTSNLTLT